MISLATVEYEIKGTELHFTYKCEECGVIVNSAPFSQGDDNVHIIRSYIDKHDRLHRLAKTGEISEKFITMVKGV